MDMKPTITQNWLYAALVGVIAALAVVGRAALFWDLVFGIWSVRQELTDPFVGPAILREAGQRYVTHFYLSALLALALQRAALYGRWSLTNSMCVLRATLFRPSSLLGPSGPRA
jgi:hypothetical protein